MILSEHFNDTELRVQDAPEQVIANARWLCVNILEAVRAHFGAPITVTSGYRPPARNQAAGGVHNSYHLYQGDDCAADIRVAGQSPTAVFDWLRLESQLPFHKVILEMDHATGQPSIVHIQAHSQTPVPVRQAFIGETHNTSGYTQVECV